MTQEQFIQAEQIQLAIRKTKGIIDKLTREIPFDTITFYNSITEKKEVIECNPAVIADIRTALLEQAHEQLNDLNKDFQHL